MLSNEKRETARSLFFVCGLPQHARQAYHFVGSVSLLCAFFMDISAIAKSARGLRDPFRKLFVQFD